jgi:hypothetical protein
VDFTPRHGVQDDDCCACASAAGEALNITLCPQDPLTPTPDGGVPRIESSLRAESFKVFGVARS